MTGPCPTPERLAAALRGLQRSADEAELAGHLEACPACRARLEELAGGSGWLTGLAKTRAITAPAASKSLDRAMEELESSLGIAEREAPTAPPRLDFLQPSDRPGVLGRFGPYDVIAHVASGGMGIVLKARDAALDRVVALKILPPTHAANALARARFVREARSAAAVVHEHVVPIYAVDEQAGLPYLVMQFVQGRTLAERIRATGPLRLEEILRIGAQTAAGLAAAHAQGLVHRDVKPGNILLENSVERVKLTDFGLARALDDSVLTRTGELAGTPEFMAPEQAGNGAVDHRVDLFSLGTVLYAMGTGCSPFQGNSVVAVIRKVCDEQPPAVHEVNPAMPRWLSGIVARLMAKAPAERFQSAEEVARLLERYLARVQHGDFGELRGTPGASRAGARARRRIALGAGALLCLGALWFFLATDRRHGPAPSPARPLPPDPFVVSTGTGARVGSFADLEAAFEASPADGIVDLCWTGPREMPAIRLPPKSLTLRAGRGFRPEWVVLKASGSALGAAAPLTLEGIQFLLNPVADGRSADAPGGRALLPPRAPHAAPGGTALVAVTNAVLRVAHCVFKVIPRSERDLACLQLWNVSECRLDSTLLLAPMEKGVVWQRHAGGPASPPRETRLTITNCIAAAGEAVWLDLEAGPGARLEMFRNTFTGPSGLYFPPGYTTTNLEVNAARNLFDSGCLMFDARPALSRVLTACIHWSEREDLLSPVRRYVMAPAPAPEEGPSRLSEWNRWWNQDGEDLREVRVAYASGRSDVNPGGGLPPAEPQSFQVTDLQVTEGPPLPREEWSRFGADAARVGPRPDSPGGKVK